MFVSFSAAKMLIRIFALYLSVVPWYILPLSLLYVVKWHSSGMIKLVDVLIDTKYHHLFSCLLHFYLFLDPPTIQNFTTSSKKSWIGQTVTLKCLSDGVPTPTLSWYKPEGSEINRVRARENKVQVPLRGDQDFGHYKCIAANGLIPSDENLIKINQISKFKKNTVFW